MPLPYRRWCRTIGLLASLGLFGGACLQTKVEAAQKSAQAPPTSFIGDVKPVLDKYCLKCHGSAMASAGINFSLYTTPDQVLSSADVWAKVSDRLATMQMPPDGMPQPSASARKRAVDWIQNALKTQCKLADPGRVTIRRLNRVEYDNTIHDLTGLKLHVSDDFPSDDVGYGFDNIGDVLSISPLLMEKYLSAAEKISRQLIQVPGSKIHRYAADEFSGAKGTSKLDTGFTRFSGNATVEKEINVQLPGNYRIKTLAFGDLVGPDLPKLVISVDKTTVATFEVGVRRDHPTVYEAPLSLEAGKHTISVSFANSFSDPQLPQRNRNRNVYFNYIELTGPTDGKIPLTSAYLKVVPVQPQSPEQAQTLARVDIKKFATRAYRRPVTSEELDRLVKLFNVGYKSGGTFDHGMQLAVEGILVSPNFLFRVELDPKNNGTQVRPLNDYELASRLSYFLWSSMPDDQLLDLAAQGKLHQDVVLNQQVKRMLLDPKAQALADNFAGQWLQLRKLAIIEPNPKQFPGIDDAMKGYMATETKMYFNSVLQNNRPITDFIDSNYTFINEPLARLYGIPGVTGDAFQKVEVSEPRGGVLTQASVLTVTSNPTRTSPTKRGKWVLEQILGTPPPPPPPGVSQISDEQSKISVTTIRQLMEEHRKNPMCAACHAKMDPIGFGMENFDAVGRWRTKDGNFDVDTTGTLPTGKSFKGATDLKKILLSDKEAFARALAEKLLTYGLGRGVESADKCSVDAIVKRAATNDYRFESLLIAVIDSDPFRKRKGEISKT